MIGRRGILLWMCLLTGILAHAQRIVISGVVKDKFNEERIPFASVSIPGTTWGALTDSAGKFEIVIPQYKDSIEVSSVGFQTQVLFIPAGKTELYVEFLMERGKFNTGVVLKSKTNRGLLMWRRIVKRKPFNDRYRFSNFSYELYNKLELDLNRINKDKVVKAPLPGVKQFSFVLNNIDSTEKGEAFLPVFLTETISDYYYQEKPKRYKEIIKASKTMGVDNESVSKLLGGMYQNINVYNNFIPIFDKEFVSPISDNGDAYYNYKVADTQYVSKRRFFHLIFTPKRKGENTFEGDCWVHDTTFAIQKMTLRLSRDANVNYVEALDLVQEYRLTQDSIWFLSKDKFVVNISPIGKSKFGFIGKKTTTYKDVLVNQPFISDTLAANNTGADIIYLPTAKLQTDSIWNISRHEGLNKNEQAIYNMIDTLQRMPLFKTYKRWLGLLGTGYMNVGNFEVGPWYNVATYNVHEGFRVRADLGTNPRFHKKLYLHGYVAYGFRDQAFKGKAEALYVKRKFPRETFYASLTHDLDNGQVYYDEIGTDNIFAMAVRKPGVPLKFLQVTEQKLEYFREWHSGFSVQLYGIHKQFNPLRNIPGEEFFPVEKGQSLNTTEVGVRFRYAYLEKFLEGNYHRISLGSPYPMVELRITQGVPNVLNSAYRYTRVNVSVSDDMKLPPYGSFHYNVYAGRAYGTVPYMMLNVLPGNEIYYYNKYAFSLMNRFEYITDRYVGAAIEHNIGNGIFRLLPITRKMGWRQFWNVKTIYGDLSEANQQLNFVPGSPFINLSGKTYMEVGTGVDNILRLFRVDLVWRLLPTPLPASSVARFGVFGSFRLAF